MYKQILDTETGEILPQSIDYLFQVFIVLLFGILILKKICAYLAPACRRAVETYQIGEQFLFLLTGKSDRLVVEKQFKIAEALSPDRSRRM